MGRELKEMVNASILRYAIQGVPQCQSRTLAFARSLLRTNGKGFALNRYVVTHHLP